MNEEFKIQNENENANKSAPNNRDYGQNREENLSLPHHRSRNIKCITKHKNTHTQPVILWQSN